MPLNFKPLNFDRSLNAPYGVEVRLSQRVGRLLAANPGPFTFKGTGVYLIGAGESVAVIDPGPALPNHIEALKKAIGTRTISHILITHTHRDHSPAAAALKAWSGAKTYSAPSGFSFRSAPKGSPSHAEITSPAIRSAGGGGGPALAEKVVDEAHDHDFVPDVVLKDGDAITGDGFTLAAVATPGHTANHLCFALAQEQALFSGDHVMGWSTSVIAPPDGDMAAYRASLQKLIARGDQILYPTHGSPITDPHIYLRELAAHRAAREAQILEALAKGDDTVAALTLLLYPDIAQQLRGAAAIQVQAHLDELLARGAVIRDGLSYRVSAGTRAPDRY